MHANTTIPEIHGAARAWEVTGDPCWRAIVDAYWRCAVTNRGYFATGGQTCGEIWTPPFRQAAHLSEKNQEHCTVFNMMRLADYLLRWTGDVTYADYWERNLINGILAQQCGPEPEYEESLSMFQRPELPRGMIAYFLPLHAGGFKRWGRPTEDFWCCHGSLVQAHARHAYGTHYVDADGLVLAQYIPTELAWERDGVAVSVTLTEDGQTAEVERPNAQAYRLHVACRQPVEFTLKIRLPWWLAAAPVRHPQRDAAGRARDPVQLLCHPSHMDRRPAADRPAQAPFGLAAARPSRHRGLYGWAGGAGWADRRRPHALWRRGASRKHAVARQPA